MGVAATGDAIIAAGYKGKKPVQLVVCGAGQGGKDSFAKKLADYLTSALGKSVTVYASPNEVTLRGVWFPGGISANPGPGGWVPFEGAANANF